MRKYWLSVVASYSFFILANILDILSSLGQPELNPLMQSDGSIIFSLKKALFVKILFLLYYVFLGAMTYAIVAPVSRRLACIFISAIPIQTTVLLVHVAVTNVLG